MLLSYLRYFFIHFCALIISTLEQTKRDLNREMAARAALENAGGGSGSGGSKNAGGKKGGMGLMMVLMIAIACALAGIKLANSGSADFLQSVPVLGDALDFDDEEASSVVGAAGVATADGAEEL